MRNRIVSILCVLLSLAIIAVIAIDYSKGFANQKYEISDFAEKMSALEKKKKDAEKILFQHEKDYDEIEKKSTVSILLCGMSEDIYNLAFPLLNNSGVSCTIVISGDRLPGKEGLLNDSQILEMVTAGWKLIPGWAEGDGDSGVRSSAKWISDYGYDFEGAVYINSADLTDEIKSVFAAEGYDTVITDVGSGNSEYITDSEIGDLWQINAMGYGSKGPKGILNDTIEVCGNIVFTVGFENEENLFDETTLQSMVDYLKTCEAQGYILISSVSEARKYRADMDLRLSSFEQSVSSERAEQKSIIEEAEAEIELLYDEYLK